MAFAGTYVKADIETCERRDVKGLYRMARAGKIPNFTGISAPYEPPENCELVVDTTSATVSECVKTLIDYVRDEFPKKI